MYLVSPGGVKKYKSPEEILVDYLEIRIKMYSRRRTHLIEKLTAEVSIMNHKARFIKMVTEGSLVVFRRSMTDIYKELKQYDFPEPFWSKFMDIPTYQYTLEEVSKLTSKVQKLEHELDTLKRTSVSQLWKQNLDSL
jgi:DNA topoisomerase-2